MLVHFEVKTGVDVSTVIFKLTESHSVTLFMLGKGLLVFDLEALVCQMNLKISIFFMVLHTACSKVTLVKHIDVELLRVIKPVD